MKEITNSKQTVIAYADINQSWSWGTQGSLKTLFLDFRFYYIIFYVVINSSHYRVNDKLIISGGGSAITDNTDREASQSVTRLSFLKTNKLSNIWTLKGTQFKQFCKTHCHVK